MAALTAFLFTTTPMAVIRVKAAKRLKSREPIWFGARNSVAVVAVFLGRLFLVPFVVLVRQRAAELVQTRLVVDHLVTRVAGHRILLLEEDRLLGADFLAHAA